MNMKYQVSALVTVLLVGSTLTPACSRDVQAVTPQQLQQQYGITDAYAGQVTTADGTLRGTLVPVVLADGRKAQLIIPDRRADEPHAVYFRDEQGLHPIELQANASREQFASTPQVVGRRAEAVHP